MPLGTEDKADMCVNNVNCEPKGKLHRGSSSEPF